MLAHSLFLQSTAITFDQVVGVVASVGLQLAVLQGENGGDRLIEQGEIMGDHQHAAPICGEPLDQPGLGVEVEMVGRLVEEQDIGLGKEDPGQLHPSPLSTGHGDHGLVQLVVPDPESGRHALCLCLGHETALGLELLVETAETGDASVSLLTVEVVKSPSGLLYPALQGTDLPGHENSLQRRGVWMLQFGQRGLLGEIAESARTQDGPLGGSESAGERLHQSGLARPVPAHEADAVA